MTSTTPAATLPPGRGADPRAGLPPELVVPGARAEVRARLTAAGGRVVVLDDDPTGSQLVHDVLVTLEVTRAALAEVVAAPGSTGFVLTNSRSLAEPEARRLAHRTAADAYGLEASLGGRVELVSRSDSCLRGHVLAEVDALCAESVRVAGRAVDGVLFAPALPSAGRFTVDDVHWAVVGGVPVPVAETEFARDPTFGYTSSHLPTFLEERSGGAVRAADVLSVSLDDIRTGGPDRVAERLLAARDAAWVVVNAVSDHDLDVVALALTTAQERGHRFVHRCGPTFAAALGGIEPRVALTGTDIALPAGSTGHGLVVVGSHTRATTDQLERLRALDGLVEVELEVARLLREGQRDAHLAAVVDRVGDALAGADVVLATSRQVAGASAGRTPLEVARLVSDSLVAVVAASRSARPSWVLSKGGITSHDVALRGLGMARATVAGQFATPGISLFVPREDGGVPRRPPLAVFPGNVGGPDALTAVVEVLRTAPLPTDPGRTDTARPRDED